MSASSYLPRVDRAQFTALVEQGQLEPAFDLLMQPLHEELYRRQNFEFLAELTDGQRMMLCFDYIRMQAGQGGFIQLIQNGYISLLLPVIEGLQHYNIAPEMAQVLDDVLKVYVLNQDGLTRETTVEEFSKLYEEFREFEALDRRFGELQQTVLVAMLQVAMAHANDFSRSEDTA